jgi:hypothetical protein
MPKVTFSARSGKGRVRNISARPRLGQDEFRAAFADARPLAPLPGDKSGPLSLAAIGEVPQRTLRSSGGRPALEGAEGARRTAPWRNPPSTRPAALSCT